jgi:hypothetical protein
VDWNPRDVQKQVDKDGECMVAGEMMVWTGHLSMHEREAWRACMPWNHAQVDLFKEIQS